MTAIPLNHVNTPHPDGIQIERTRMIEITANIRQRLSRGGSGGVEAKTGFAIGQWERAVMIPLERSADLLVVRSEPRIREFFHGRRIGQGDVLGPATHAHLPGEADLDIAVRG